MTEPGSDYLWDRSGPVDPDVAALEAVLAPLVAFCADPRRAADGSCPDLLPPREGARLKRGWRRDADVTMQYLRAGAPRLLVHRALDRLRRLRS